MSLNAQLMSLASAIRFPEQTKDQDADTQRRLAIYQSLFYNNVEGFIRNGFPVLRSIYANADWHSMVRAFFQQHHCRSPYFIDISKEFVEFLSNVYAPTDRDPVFLKELAHYEWIELALSVRKTDYPIRYWNGDGIPDRFYRSPLTELVGYPYPVHQIGPDFMPASPGEQHYYLLYREQNNAVGFQYLNPLAALVFELLDHRATTLSALCDQVIQHAPTIQMPAVVQGVEQLMVQWLKCGAVVEADWE